MSDADDDERQLRMKLMAIQIDKAEHDMRLESRKFWLQVVTVGISAGGLIIAAFAAGHFLPLH